MTGAGGGTWPTVLSLAAGTVVTALGYLLFARLLRVTELRTLRVPGLSRR